MENQRSVGVPPTEDFEERGRDAHAPFLNPFEEIEQTRFHLPHWQQDEAWQFVTWRLGDSIPKVKLQTWAYEKGIWLKMNPPPWNEMQEMEYHQRFSRALDEWLDTGYGSCVLRDPRCADIVSNAFRHFDGQRYALGSFVVMPNHVHVLFRPYPSYKLGDVVHSWKSFTAKEINKTMGSKGKLWQDDYWDRMVRHETHLLACLRYIEDNPVMASLKMSEYILYRNLEI